MTKKKKVVLVTGAGSGLGKAIALYLASRDIRVFCTDMNESSLVFNNNPNISTTVMDITDDNSIKHARKVIQETFSGLDGIVNNAGIFDQFPMVEGDTARYENIIQVNVIGAYRVSNAFFPLLYKNRGRIINISSETAKTLLPFQTYGSSKYMLEAWSNVMRMELKLLNMYVSLIRAGGHKTALMKKTLEVLQNVPEDSMFRKALEKIKKTGGKKVMDVKNDPLDVAKTVYRALSAKKPKKIYSVNESALFKFLPLLPEWLKEYVIIKTLE